MASLSRRLNISVTAISKSVARGERLAMTKKYLLVETEVDKFKTFLKSLPI